MTVIDTDANRRAWDELFDDFKRKIELGYWDDRLREIAATCFIRRDETEKEKKEGVYTEVDRGQFILPWVPEERMRDFEDAVRAEERGVVLSKVIDHGQSVIDACSPLLPKDQHIATQANAAAKDDAPKASKPSSSRPRRGSFKKKGDLAFRFTDGRLYNKADVVGRTMPCPDHSGYTVKVVGVGNRAAKMIFVDQSGVACTLPSQVPLKYREKDENGNTKIKDPIFMGLAVLERLLRTATPVEE